MDNRHLEQLMTDTAKAISRVQGSPNGIGVLELLGVCFIVLKLSHLIDWSWWWVTAPFWAGVTVFFIITIFGVLAVVVTTVLNRRGRE